MRKTLMMVAVAALVAAPVRCQEPAPSDDPLAGLERLVGGQWYLGDDSYQVFEWGLERRSMNVEMFFVTPTGEKRVSEMVFAFHPGEGVVKGYGVAIDMGIDFFEYDIRFEGETIVLDLEAFGDAAMGAPTRETWTFLDGDRYQWELLAKTDDGAWATQMDGVFQRRR